MFFGHKYYRCVRCHLAAPAVCFFRHRFVLPYIAQIVAAFYTEAVEVGRKLLCGVGGVDYGDGVASVAERAHEDLMRVGVHLAFSRNAERVLVDGDNLAVE